MALVMYRFGMYLYAAWKAFTGCIEMIKGAKTFTF